MPLGEDAQILREALRVVAGEQLLVPIAEGCLLPSPTGDLEPHYGQYASGGGQGLRLVFGPFGIHATVLPPTHRPAARGGFVVRRRFVVR